MNIALLIGEIVRQTMVLIAQLATTGGARAPLAQVANQVFLDLVSELERQGVSRKVSADMFGMGLRSYLRRVQRLGESSTERGRSLWEAVLGYAEERSLVSREEVLLRFHRDDEVLVRGVLHDLTESGLLFVSGVGPGSIYRAATSEELGTLRLLRRGAGLEELVWAIVYREGPLTREALVKRGGIAEEELDHALAELVAAQRVELGAGGQYRARSFVVPLDAPNGFEAAVFDHFQAAAKTICCRLRDERPPLPAPAGVAERDLFGGSTFTFDLWAGHGLAPEVLSLLAEQRARLGELRQRVEAYNAAHGVPADFVQVIHYLGQCLIPQGEGSEGQENER